MSYNYGSCSVNPVEHDGDV